MANRERAKIFQNGGSQAVRLPKSCRFPDGEREVLVRRVGNRIILESPGEWSPEMIAALGGWSEPIERPKQQPVSATKDPFR